ncbi:hypothetical protein [Sulfurimonas sp.]
MKKIFTFGVVFTLGALLLVGCTPSTSSNDGEAQKHLTKPMTLQEVHNAIMQAGEKAGWRMTEFKENTVIAEKIDGDESTSVTVEFSNDSFNTSPENDELNDIIENALEK